MQHVLAGFDQEKYFRLLREGEEKRARQVLQLWLHSEDEQIQESA